MKNKNEERIKLLHFFGQRQRPNRPDNVLRGRIAHCDPVIMHSISQIVGVTYE